MYQHLYNSDEINIYKVGRIINNPTLQRIVLL